MNKLPKNKKDQVRTFMTVSNANEGNAIVFLTKADWNLERAIDLFFQNPNMQAGSADANSIQSFFNAYANDPEDLKFEEGNQENNKIGPNGMFRLLKDIDVDPSNIRALILAWKMKAGTECEFSWDEFREGCQAMKVDSVDKLRTAAQSWMSEMEDRAQFKQLYQFSFNYAKSASMKSLGIEAAIAYWTLIFDSKDARVPVWISFCQERQLRGIPRDTWNLFFDFLTTTNDDYSNYDADGAWPVLIDEFVDYAKTRL